ncbi:TrbC/VirB2 family protein [Arthrobacter sp.]|uniref:TrbC/VirB2 family protein n=1 Tax=Arthrobacter sp. TaxID=1667 RepID=UPI003A8DEB60
MNTITTHAARAANIMAEPKPLPSEVTDSIDTVVFWVQGIGGGIAVIGLLFVAIGGFFSHRHGQGAEFIGKVGWWIAGAVLFGLAGVIAPIFLGL